MTIYLVNSFSSSDKAFTDKQLAEAYLEEVDKDGIFIFIINIDSGTLLQPFLQCAGCMAT